jgi:predicted small integral membrane protein
MMLFRLCKIAMIAALAAFAFIVAYDNIVDYDSNYEFVRHVLSMDTTFPNNALMGRAITDKRIWTIAYAAIIAVEALTCLLLSVGALALLTRLNAPAERFNRAKVLAVAGLTVGFGLWFFGFLVVAGEYFSMWQSQTWNGQEAAFRIVMVMLGVLIFVTLSDPRRRVISAQGIKAAGTSPSKQQHTDAPGGRNGFGEPPKELAPRALSTEICSLRLEARASRSPWQRRRDAPGHHPAG